MPTKTTISYNLLAAALFAVIGITSLLARGWLLGIGFLCLGISFVLLGASSKAWSSAPVWRRGTTILFQLAAVILIVIGLLGASK